MIEARYRLKFYINAYHFIRWQGHDGAVHPHTWEIVSDFSCLTDEEVPFTDYEKKIGTFLAHVMLEKLEVSEGPTRSYILMNID